MRREGRRERARKSQEEEGTYFHNGETATREEVVGLARSRESGQAHSDERVSTSWLLDGVFPAGVEAVSETATQNGGGTIQRRVGQRAVQSIAPADLAARAPHRK